jgi:SAM-dependent methyltransferase
MIATPSGHQLDVMPRVDYTRADLSIPCQRCGRLEASTAIVLMSQDTTLAVCTTCDQELAAEARCEILTRLERQPPYPGERVIYQPVELEECADWQVLRPDSATRVHLMTEILREVGLPGNGAPVQASYLDVGCNTGYFCHAMRRVGFFAEGVDVVEGDIAVARLLDTHFRRDQVMYVVADAYDYLRDTQERKFDVTSGFAVFQWVMIQTTVERGIACLEWLFEKTRRVCFLEMGYAAEQQYRDRLPAELDQRWVQRLMQERGGFAEVRIYSAKEHGLMHGSRDLFVGIR